MNNEGIKSFIKECFDKQTQELKDFVSLELPEEFQRNPYFFKGKQTKVAPSTSYSTGIKVSKCFQKDGNSYPHLFHTFDPQLNNITDMLRELLDDVGNKQQKSIIDDLEKSRDLLIELIEKQNKGKEPLEEKIGINQKLLLEIIDLLQKITSRQEAQRCITIADLEKLGIKPIKGEGNKEIQPKPKKDYILTPLWRL